MELINAAEAKRISDGINKTKHENELKRVLEGIAKRAKSGDYAYYGDGTLMNETAIVLAELGYNVENGGRMNEHEYVITWK